MKPSDQNFGHRCKKEYGTWHNYFIKVLTNDTTQYPGAISFSGIATVTEFQIQTTGGPIKLTVNIVYGGGVATLFVTGEDCNGFLGTGQFYDFNGEGIPSRYFQLQEVSNDWGTAD